MKYILNKKYWFIVKTLVFITIIIPLGIVAYEVVILGNESTTFHVEYPRVIVIVIAIYYSTLFVFGLIWLVMQLKSVFYLINETKKSELRHLQSQVNPHFFFNMLNNLYGMVDKDAEKSKNLILKLSDLMRYSIYEGEKKDVSLVEEITYLKNYIELHKMRYHKEIDIIFKMTNIDENIKIMPLLLIILLENAFKHGVENLHEKAYVHINLKTDKKRLLFEIENNFDEKEIPKEKGIGIKNLKRRLELVYPTKYKLNIVSIDSVYKAQLEIQL